jgi:hypothetical protein
VLIRERGNRESAKGHLTLLTLRGELMTDPEGVNKKDEQGRPAERPKRPRAFVIVKKSWPGQRHPPTDAGEPKKEDDR